MVHECTARAVKEREMAKQSVTYKIKAYSILLVLQLSQTHLSEFVCVYRKGLVFGFSCKYVMLWKCFFISAC